MIYVLKNKYLKINKTLIFAPIKIGANTMKKTSNFKKVAKVAKVAKDSKSSKK